MKLAGGPLQLGIGANFNKEKFKSKPSPFAQGILADPVAGTLCDPVNGPDPATSASATHRHPRRTRPAAIHGACSASS